MVAFRPATRADIVAMAGEDVPYSCFAVAAEIDGELAGCGAVYYCGGLPIAFSTFNENMRKEPLALARGAVKVMEIVKKHDCFAIADDRHDGAPDLLRRLGFKEIEGGHFRWVK